MELNIEKLKKEMARAGYKNTDEMSKAFGGTRQALDRIIKYRTTKLVTINRLAVFFAIDPKDLLI